MRHIVQFSGGKDSTAMLNIMLEKGMHIDEVVFYDTGWEFDSVYENIRKNREKVEALGIKFTTLSPKYDFNYLGFEKEVHKRNGTTAIGYSWCGGLCRWGTREKIRALEKYCKGAIEYIAIAYDEPRRIEKERNGVKRFPLNEWKMTEAQALEYCYQNGYEYIEEGYRLYDLLDRASCYCCANKNLKELRNIYLYLPKYWQKLKELQAKTNRPYKKVGLEALEERFRKELKGSIE